ncbi:MAG: O-antigen ligase [Planctomycetota bacterium]|jgi:O-antigen ligase
MIVLLPPLLVMVVALLKSQRHSLVFVAIPCLLFLPSYYTHKFPGIPVATFHNYLFIVLFAFILLGKDRRLFDLRGTDLILGIFTFLCVYSEYENKGFVEGRNLLAVKLMGVLVPYYIGKMLAKDNCYLIGTLTTIIALGAVIGFVSPIEARLGTNPFDFWRSYWPASVPWDGALYRFGLRRVAGPFAHPICQGFFFSLAIPISIWLCNMKRPTGLARRRIIVLGLIVGLLLCGSRGPWLGTIIAVTFPVFLWRKSRVVLVLAAALFMLILPALIWEDLSSYVSIDRGQATSESQETAAYRWEMLENYLEVVDERPWIGFGKDQIPIVKGLKSIDNQYLFVALMHGLPAAIAFLACILIPAIQILWGSLRRSSADPLARFGIVLAGCLLGAIFTQSTVFAGTQTEQVLFLLVGISTTIRTRLARMQAI